MARFKEGMAIVVPGPALAPPQILRPDRPTSSGPPSGLQNDMGAWFIESEDPFLLGVLNSAPAFEYMKGTCSALGDEEKGGRLRFFGQYIETLPIPDAPVEERKAMAKLAQQALRVHKERRNRVEQFLQDIGISPAQGSSRNRLEEPWQLTKEELRRRSKDASWQLAIQVREETAGLTEQIAKIEREIDERMAHLYAVW